MLLLHLCQLREARARNRPSPLQKALNSLREALAERAETLPQGPLLWVDFANAAPPMPVAAQGSLLEGAPLPTGEFAGIAVCLQLAWLDFPAAIADCIKRLRPGGGLVFATLGPDTLQELRQAWHQADPDYPHVHPFADMHGLGDALHALGLARVVLDAERTCLAYEDLRHALAAFKPEGMHNLLADRRMGLTGKQRWQTFYQAREADAKQRQRKTLSVELIFGMAFRPTAGRQVRVAVPVKG